MNEFDPNGFWFGEEFLEYFDHTYNNTKTNERRAEVPIALQWLGKFKPETPITEFGCVMPHYVDGCTHEVVDLYEATCPTKGCLLNVDGETFDYKGKAVLSVSTIEHVKHDKNYIEKTGYYPEAAYKLLQKIMEEASEALVTWPVGVHCELDRSLFNDFDLYKVRLLERNQSNEWREIYDENALLSRKYGSPYWSGNVLIVVEKK